MSESPQKLHPLRSSNVVGTVFMTAGLALVFVPMFFGVFSVWMVGFGTGIAVFGALLIVPDGKAALATVAEAGSRFNAVAVAVAERGGRRDTDPVVVTTEYVVPDADGVVPPVVPAEAPKPKRARRTKADAVAPVTPRTKPLKDPPPPAAKLDG